MHVGKDVCSLCCPQEAQFCLVAVPAFSSCASQVLWSRRDTEPHNPVLSFVSWQAKVILQDNSSTTSPSRDCAALVHLTASSWLASDFCIIQYVLATHVHNM